MVREIDDINKRKKYKEERFGDKKSSIDDYTGEKVFRGNKRDSKNQHPSYKTSDTDHITPLKVVEKRYKGLSKEQQQVLANNTHNYATVNSHLNRSKGDLENHQYLYRQLKKGEAENFTTTNRMLHKEIESRATMRAKATVMYTQNMVDNTKNFVSEQTGRFMSEDFRQINAAGVDEAINSAMFAAVFSTTKNTISVVKGEEGAQEAIKEILYDTSSAAVLGYVTGAVKETFDIGANGDAALLVNGTIQISKQVFSYMSGEINEQQLMEGVAETTIYLVAAHIGRDIGSLVGEAIIPIPYVGAYIGQYIGEMITTAVCAEVISTIKFSKEFDKQNSKIISLYKQAEAQIRDSQARLEYLIRKENEVLSSTIKEGFERIVSGIQNDSYIQIKNGIMTIGEKFGMSKEDFAEGEVTQENLFADSDDILIIR